MPLQKREKDKERSDERSEREKSIIPSPKKGSKDQYMKKDSLRSFHHFILVYHKLAKGVFLITMVFMFMVDASEYPVVSS